MGDYASSILAETWFDVSEDFDALMMEWYGDLAARFDTEDEDFEYAVRTLTRSYRFWRFNPDSATAYEKLRQKYDATLDAYAELYEENLDLHHRIRLHGTAPQSEKTIDPHEPVLIKGGSTEKKERRNRAIRTSAA